MTDELIFTLADVNSIRSVSTNIEDFEQYARLAQMNYLQKLLGDKLYTSLQNDLSSGIPASNRFTELVNGVVYQDGRDVIFRGVKLYCVYVWLHLYMAESALAITPTGGKIFKDEQADYNEAKKAFRNAEARFIAAADGLEEPILNFLRVKYSVYPEFEESQQIEQAKNDNLTFKVIGKSFNAPGKPFF